MSLQSDFLDFITKAWLPNISQYLADLKLKRDKDFFIPHGTQIFVGKQGSGKTISAVRQIYLLKERYPKCVIVSNIDLKHLQALKFKNEKELLYILERMNKAKHYIQFDTMEELELVLVKVNNAFEGVIYIIDEIHTYFNSLESKNIPMYIFTEISQQRKQRKLIIGTSQLFLRMAKPLREQCDNVIVCRTFLGFITLTIAYEGMTLEQDYSGKLIGQKRKMGWYYHTSRIRLGFDTFQKVVSGAEQYEQINRIQMVDKKGKSITIK